VGFLERSRGVGLVLGSRGVEGRRQARVGRRCITCGDEEVVD